MGSIKEKKGLLFVLTAPSGCGKTSVLTELLKDPSSPKRSITYTTRQKRQGEKEGQDYHFVTREEFEKKKKDGFFLESACVYNNFYGTAKEDVEKLLDGGTDVIVSVDVQGAKTIRSKMAAVLFFLTPPSLDILRSRLEGRGTESEESLKRRLEAAREEMEHKEFFDFTITNDSIEHSTHNLKSMVDIERNKRRN